MSVGMRVHGNTPHKGKRSTPKPSPNPMRLLETALAETSDGVMIVDRDGLCVFLNAAGRHLMQRAPLPGVPVEEQAVSFDLRYPDRRPIAPEDTPLIKRD